jgi:23S rRNA pseudouridine1911/1915/1917 synthase
MPQEQVIHIQVDQSAARLDLFLAEAVPDLSRSQIKKLIHQGVVSLRPSTGDAKTITRPSTRIEIGDVIELHLPVAQPNELQPEEIPLDIVFEDDDLVVINKPAGLVVHPAQGHDSGTLVNG